MTKTSKMKKPAAPAAVPVQPSRHKRRIAVDYSIRATHDLAAVEIVEALGDFGDAIWVAGVEILGESKELKESKDRYDGLRFCGVVLDEIVELINRLDDDDYGQVSVEEMRARVYGKARPAGLVETKLGALTDQLQRHHEKKMSTREILMIDALRQFGINIMTASLNCLNGQDGVDAEVFWRTVAHAAVKLADDRQRDESGNYIDESMAEQVATAINSEYAVGVIEIALLLLDQALTYSESKAKAA
jgi:hypothetical protein